MNAIDCMCINVQYVHLLSGVMWVSGVGIPALYVTNCNARGHVSVNVFRSPPPPYRFFIKFTQVYDFPTRLRFVKRYKLDDNE